MKGVSYVCNDKGERIAVQLDLKTHRELVEDMLDRLIIQERANEPNESLASVKRRYAAKGKRVAGSV